MLDLIDFRLAIITIFKELKETISKVKEGMMKMLYQIENINKKDIIKEPNGNFAVEY